MFFVGGIRGESISFYRNNKGSNTFEFCNMDFFLTTNKQGPGKRNFVQKKHVGKINVLNSTILAFSRNRR